MVTKANKLLPLIVQIACLLEDIHFDGKGNTYHGSEVRLQHYINNFIECFYSNKKEVLKLGFTLNIEMFVNISKYFPFGGLSV